jgi:hypothetical membrane protein
LSETEVVTSKHQTVKVMDTKTATDHIRFAGTLIFIAGAWNLLSTLAAESLQPNYNTSSGSGSGLGVPYFSSSPATCNTLPICAIPVQPSSAVFVFSLFLAGVFLLWAGVLLRRASHRLFGSGLSLSGGLLFLIGLSYAPFYLGTPDAGVVEDAADLHIISSLLVFILLVILMISSYRLSRGPFRFLSLSLGVVALDAFLLGLSGNYLGLGPGGVERFMIFSFDVWAIGFGAHLLSAPG